MEVGKILTVGEILKSTMADWERWSTDLTEYAFADN